MLRVVLDPNVFVSSLLEADAILVPGTADVTGSVPEDLDDQIVLACAVDGDADLIVSGDQHLLDQGEIRGIEIVRVRMFLERLNTDSNAVAEAKRGSE